MRIYRLFIVCCISLFIVSCSQTPSKIDLSGEWAVALDSLDQGISQQWYQKSFSDKIMLPGTLCDAGYGTPCSLKPMMEKEIFLNLKRKYDYVGPAWYRKEIMVPRKWKDKEILLTLGRVIWNSQVWVNGNKVDGDKESLSTPHYFHLSKYLIPGKNNSIVIRIDNRMQHDISVKNLAHAYTNETQTMWNGILGEVSLTAKNKINIEEFCLYPDIDRQIISVIVKLNGKASGEIELTVKDPKGIALLSKSVKIEGDTVKFEYPVKNPMLWDEFTPNLYRATATLKTNNSLDSKVETFGMRKLTNKNALLQINGKRLFLRGSLECCVFPLKGYPPMDKFGWENIFSTARNYGLNHLRFHSWCPPEAAFEVADEMGFYLQVELPLWTLDIGKDAQTVQFLYDESSKIMKEYGNHPSFCFWSMGNELQGDFAVIDKLLSTLKTQDNRHLYTTTTFTFEPGHGKWPEPHDDYWVTQWTKNGWVRGQGIFDDEPPCFNKDFSQSIVGLETPLITHEVGQYSVYPNLEEIDKYKGNLIPLNFEAIKQDLDKKGRLSLAHDNMLASGSLAVILYKEEIERALKTPGLSGFQLLNLTDFPGQGTALVGILDAFWESKGLITPEKFRRFCSPVVPLARFDKATYTNNEILNVHFEAANFSNTKLKDIQPIWSLNNSKGDEIAQGELKKQDVPIGNAIDQGDISIPLNKIQDAERLTLSFKYKGTDYQNSWNIWVYPHAISTTNEKVLYTRNFAEAEKALSEGKTVLLNPELKDIYGLEGKFVQVFWSPVHFPNQPGTMGILCDPSHPALADFPTEMHSNWQWWDICKNAKTIDLDSLKNNIQPIVRMIDNFYKNRNLGLIFEANVKSGKLLFCSADLSKDLNERPVARQLRYSLLKYMASDKFNPQDSLTVKEIETLHNVNRIEERKKSIYE